MGFGGLRALKHSGKESDDYCNADERVGGAMFRWILLGTEEAMVYFREDPNS
jgi:hypothetical protein